MLDSISHFEVMKKWSIHDARYTVLFTYLTHFYKFKLISVIGEKMNSTFLDQYNSEHFYADGKSSLISSFIQFFKNELKTLEKLKKNAIFEALLLETIRRILFMFFIQLHGISKHENFDLHVLHSNYLISELLEFNKQWTYISKYIQNNFGFELHKVDIYVRITYIKQIIEEIITTLLYRLIEYIKPDLQNTIKNCSFKELDLSNICASIKSKEEEMGILHNKIYERYQIFKYDLILELITTQSLPKCSLNISCHIEEIKNNFVSHMKEVQKAKLDDQIVYMENLSCFFTSSTFFKYQMALASIQRLLTFELSKQNLADLIKIKNYSDKKKNKEKLLEMVKIHFQKHKQLNERLQCRQKANKILVICMTCLKFIIRMKLNLKYYLMNRKKRSTHRNTTTTFLNENINFDLVNTKKNIPVKFQIINKFYMQSKFKNFTLNNA